MAPPIPNHKSEWVSLRFTHPTRCASMSFQRKRESRHLDSCFRRSDME
jgi:hypothetical protein